MKIKGFTPVFDVLVQKYDTNTALVYGKIWRVCDWSPMGVCTMSNESLGDQLGLSEKTIRRKKEVLEEDGLIKVTGKMGSSDSIAIVHDIVMSMDIVTDPSDNLSETTDNLTNEDIDSRIEIPHTAEQHKERVARAIGDFEDRKDKTDTQYPADVRELLIVFEQKFGREPTARELAYWIKVAREWLEMGVTPDHVARMYQHTLEKGLTIKGPASITFAYDAIRAGKPTSTPESRLARERRREEERYGSKGV